MIRLKREQYAVGEVEHPNGLSVTVGIFYDTPVTEDIEELTYTAQGFARTALDVWGDNHVGVSESVQDVMDREYPGRPFYVETRESGRGVQVYQPHGMPQDGTTPWRPDRADQTLCTGCDQPLGSGTHPFCFPMDAGS